MLHRTQVLLDPQHYQLLKEEAQRRQEGLSAVLRDILDSWSSQRQGTWDPEILANDPIWEMAGFIKADPNVLPDGSENIDKYL